MSKCSNTGPQSSISLPPSLLCLDKRTGGVDDGAHGGDGLDRVLPLGALA